MVAHTFNPSTRDVETGVVWLGREECKVGGDIALSLRVPRDTLSFGLR